MISHLASPLKCHVIHETLYLGRIGFGGAADAAAGAHEGGGPAGDGRAVREVLLLPLLDRQLLGQEVVAWRVGQVIMFSHFDDQPVKSSTGLT